MTNIWTSGWFHIPLTRDQIDFALAVYSNFDGCDINDPAEGVDGVQLHIIKQLKEELCSNPEELNDLSLNFNAKDDGDGIYITHDENIDIDHAAHFTHLMLKHFAISEPVLISCADTCDRPRIDGFGGCAAFVTSESVKFYSTRQWLHDMTEQHKQNQGVF